MVPDNVKLPIPNSFKGGQEGKIVKTYFNSLETYSQLTGITDNSTQVLYAKTRLVSLACNWYALQGYDDGTVTWNTLSSHLRHYLIPSNYKRRARKALTACLMG